MTTKAIDNPEDIKKAWQELEQSYYRNLSRLGKSSYLYGLWDGTVNSGKAWMCQYLVSITCLAIVYSVKTFWVEIVCFVVMFVSSLAAGAWTSHNNKRDEAENNARMDKLEERLNNIGKKYHG